MARIGWGKVAAGLAVAAAAGAAFIYARDRRSEKPEHELLLADGVYELRRYPPLLVAETVQRGKRDRALGNGFGLLADYIFGESREGQEIAMTAPVLADRVEGGWRVRFIMPSIWTRETLPAPGEGVAIGEVEPRRVAAIRFGGRPDDAMLAAKEAELRGWMAKHGHEAARGAEHAYYNSPLIPGPLRHNEVLIPLI
jgi:hypothetical protein